MTNQDEREKFIKQNKKDMEWLDSQGKLAIKKCITPKGLYDHQHLFWNEEKEEIEY